MKIPSPTGTAGSGASSKTPTPTIGRLCLLYFHIPFCTKNVPIAISMSSPTGNRSKSLFADALALEWERQLPLLAGKRIVSIYFGGGTPTSVRAWDRRRFWIGSKMDGIAMAAIAKSLSRPIPRKEADTTYCQARSLWDQSVEPWRPVARRPLASILERVHWAEKAKEAIFDARAAGFRNISIDLMYDLPGQTEESWHYTLDQIGSLPIHHLSLYNLTIEPHTSFFKRRSSLRFPTPETSLQAF